jgi:serine 3-dehydrogenase (NADP+)
MSVSLKGQGCVVVGASSGMGFSIAAAFAREGARVVAAARRTERLDALRKEGDVTPLACDVAKRKDVAAFAAAALKVLTKVDVLVYASGTNIPDRTMATLTPETWDDMIAVNLTGAFDVTRAFLPSIREHGGAHLIYISSIAGRTADNVSGPSYQAAKRGLAGLALGLRLEERKHGVRACVIYPGLCDTEILAKRPAPTPADILAQALKPEDVADAVLAVAKMHPRVAVTELEIVPAKLQ